jgi:hypothetical protein
MMTSRGLSSQARVDGLAVHREHAEDAFMAPVKRLAANEPVERLGSGSALADGGCALATGVPGSQPLDLVRVGVFGAVDDPQARGLGT